MFCSVDTFLRGRITIKSERIKGINCLRRVTLGYVSKKCVSTVFLIFRKTLTIKGVICFLHKLSNKRLMTLQPKDAY